MFKLRYNIFALVQVLISFLNYILFIKIFGVSIMADAYLLSVAILSALQLLQILFIEQFIFFYNDLKIKNIEQAYHFYHSVLLISILTGIFFFLFSFIGKDFLKLLFFNELDIERQSVLIFVLNITLIELLFTPIFTLNQKLLNAEMQFSIPYLLTIIPSIFILIAMGYLIISSTVNIELLIYGKIFGVFISLLLSFYFIIRLRIFKNIKISSILIKDFLFNSIAIRFGHNIHSFCFIPITTNILSYFPLGYPSYFYYAYRIVGVINSISVGPLFNVFQSKLSYNWSAKNIVACQKYMKDFLKYTIPFFVFLSIFIYCILPILLLYVNPILTRNNTEIIQNLFLILAFWHLVIAVESSNVTLLVAAKKSTIFILANTLFIIVYFEISKNLISFYTIYSIGIAAVCGQLINYFIYAYGVKKLLQEKG